MIRLFNRECAKAGFLASRPIVQDTAILRVRETTQKERKKERENPGGASRLRAQHTLLCMHVLVGPTSSRPAADAKESSRSRYEIASECRLSRSDKSGTSATLLDPPMDRAERANASDVWASLIRRELKAITRRSGAFPRFPPRRSSSMGRPPNRGGLGHVVIRTIAELGTVRATNRTLDIEICYVTDPEWREVAASRQP